MFCFALESAAFCPLLDARLHSSVMTAACCLLVDDVVARGVGGERVAGPIGSMSSMEVNVDMLEQMDLMDMSDHEALDVFLHSGAEDNSAASPVAGASLASSSLHAWQ